MRDDNDLSLLPHLGKGSDDILADCGLRYLVLRLVDDIDALFLVSRHQVEVDSPIKAGRWFAVEANLFVCYLSSLVDRIHCAVQSTLHLRRPSFRWRLAHREAGSDLL